MSSTKISFLLKFLWELKLQKRTFHYIVFENLFKIFKPKKIAMIRKADFRYRNY